MSIYQSIEFIKDNAKEYGKAKAKRIYIEKFLTSKKALLQKQYLKQGILAVNAQERDAYSNPEYIQLLEGLEQAVEIEETLKWKLEAAKLEIEIWRTEQANNRTQDKATQ